MLLLQDAEDREGLYDGRYAAASSVAHGVDEKAGAAQTWHLTRPRADATGSRTATRRRPPLSAIPRSWFPLRSA